MSDVRRKDKKLHKIGKKKEVQEEKKGVKEEREGGEKSQGL